jgi:hypothetical protein
MAGRKIVNSVTRPTDCATKPADGQSPKRAPGVNTSHDYCLTYLFFNACMWEFPELMHTLYRAPVNMFVQVPYG